MIVGTGDIVRRKIGLVPRKMDRNVLLVECLCGHQNINIYTTRTEIHILCEIVNTDDVKKWLLRQSLKHAVEHSSKNDKPATYLCPPSKTLSPSTALAVYHLPMIHLLKTARLEARIPIYFGRLLLVCRITKISDRILTGKYSHTIQSTRQIYSSM